MLNNELTVENADEVAEALLDSLGPNDSDVPGYSVEEVEFGGPGDDMGDEWVIGLVHDLVRDKWITVNQDGQQTSVLVFDTRAEAEADIADTLAAYSDTGE